MLIWNLTKIWLADTNTRFYLLILALLQVIEIILFSSICQQDTFYNNHFAYADDAITTMFLIRINFDASISKVLQVNFTRLTSHYKVEIQKFYKLTVIINYMIVVSAIYPNKMYIFPTTLEKNQQAITKKKDENTHFDYHRNRLSTIKLNFQ